MPDDVRISVLTQAREELIERTVQSLVGRQAGHRAHVQRGGPGVPPGGLRLGRRRARRVQGGRRRRHPRDHEVRRDLPARHRVRLEYSPEIFMDTELDFSLEICEARHGRLAARPGPRDRAQPAVHRRAVDAERLRRPDRVDVPQLLPPRARRAVGAHPQRPRHRDRRRRAGGAGRRASASRAACSATASAPATSTW